jgi:hypothetical protein
MLKICSRVLAFSGEEINAGAAPVSRTQRTAVILSQIFAAAASSCGEEQTSHYQAPLSTKLNSLIDLLSSLDLSPC